MNGTAAKLRAVRSIWLNLWTNTVYRISWFKQIPLFRYTDDDITTYIEERRADYSELQLTSLSDEIFKEFFLIDLSITARVNFFHDCLQRKVIDLILDLLNKKHFCTVSGCSQYTISQNTPPFIMRPSSLGGGRILRRTLSVRLSVCPSVPLLFILQ